jgi:GT2 family glycosyltransferase
MASVTVIIPLYNKAGSISRAVDSVLAQTMASFELLVVDDGSSDGGAELISAVADPRLRVIRQPNAGVSAARNRGVAEARSDLVAFLDADDTWEPRFLEATLAARSRYPEAVAWFSDYFEAGPSRTVPTIGAWGKVRVIRDYPDWFVRHRGNGLFSSSSLVRKDALEACGGFPEGVRNGEDTDTWFRLAWQGPVVYVGEALASYVVGVAGGLTAVTGPTYPCLCATIDRKLASGGLEGPARGSAKAAKRWLILCYASSLALSGRKAEAFRFLAATHPTIRTVRMWARAVLALTFGI